jgi:hypothetical protein
MSGRTEMSYDNSPSRAADHRVVVSSPFTDLTQACTNMFGSSLVYACYALPTLT